MSEMSQSKSKTRKQSREVAQFFCLWFHFSLPYSLLPRLQQLHGHLQLSDLCVQLLHRQFPFVRKVFAVHHHFGRRRSDRRGRLGSVGLDAHRYQMVHHLQRVTEHQVHETASAAISPGEAGGSLRSGGSALPALQTFGSSGVWNL